MYSQVWTSTNTQSSRVFSSPEKELLICHQAILFPRHSSPPNINVLPACSRFFTQMPWYPMWPLVSGFSHSLKCFQCSFPLKHIWVLDSFLWSNNTASSASTSWFEHLGGPKHKHQNWAMTKSPDCQKFPSFTTETAVSWLGLIVGQISVDGHWDG